ncbi:MAG: metallophosphoesterase family protein [Ruminococcus sp.]|nr:metallophosphoesterase family protein [Ruminococcus sp.]
MIYYIADMHFGHKNVIGFDGRPFADVELMDEVIINNWNERVTNEDTVYVLGDAFFKGEERSIEIMKRLNGHKRLIQGNHDRVHGRLRFQWEAINEYEEITDGDHFVVMSHYPMMFYKSQHYKAVMLYGHVHNTREWILIEKWQQELLKMGIPAKIINVGCMMEYMRFTPRTLNEILKGYSSWAEQNVDKLIASLEEQDT